MNKKLHLLMLVMMIILLISTTVASAQTGADDSDGDGLPDSADNCPTQSGPRENGGCPLPPPPDGDGDGLPDTADNCPGESGPADHGGCPLPPPPPDNTGNPQPDNPAPADSDGDGLPDPNDGCPSVPGDPNNNGCPPAEVPPAEPPRPSVPLVPMPTDGRCVVSLLGQDRVRIREFPTVFSEAIGWLGVNEMAEVLDVFQALFLFKAEPERVSAEDFEFWYKINHNGLIGWVAVAVVRTGGDCGPFVIPDADLPDDFLNPQTPNDNAGGVNVAAGDVNGDGAASGDEKHKDWIEILSYSWGETADVFGKFIWFDMENQTWKIVTEEGDSVMDIIVGTGAGGTNAAPQPGVEPDEIDFQLNILFCNVGSEAALTETDCVVLSTLSNPEDIQGINMICLLGVDGAAICYAPTGENAPSDPNQCATVGGTTFCADEILPGEMCFTDPDDGHLICTGFEMINLFPLDPQSSLPGLGVLAPEEQPILIGLLLPAVQKVRG